jgi:Phosphatidylserine decarboxylase
MVDVHVNRFPTSGRVEYVKYVPGKKWFAIAPKASEINERFYVGRNQKGAVSFLCRSLVYLQEDSLQSAKVTLWTEASVMV